MKRAGGEFPTSLNVNKCHCDLQLTFLRNRTVLKVGCGIKAWFPNNFLVPATHRRPTADIEEKLKLVQPFFHCGADDLEKCIWKHDCGRSPVGCAVSEV